MNMKAFVIACSLILLMVSGTNIIAQQSKLEQPVLTGQFNPKNVFDQKNQLTTKTSVSLMVGDGGSGRGSGFI